MKNKVALKAAVDALKKSNNLFETFFKNGSLSLELYAPGAEDLQTPHTRDEVYIVSRGSGFFEVEGKRTAFETGDFLFVAAGDQHRFVNYSADFMTWVLFYGPEGGEKGQIENSLERA